MCAICCLSACPLTGLWSQSGLQAKLLEKGSFEAARAVGRQAHDENADLQALTRSQERVWGNKNSVGFNIIAPPGLPPEPLQVSIWPPVAGQLGALAYAC